MGGVIEEGVLGRGEEPVDPKYHLIERKGRDLTKQQPPPEKPERHRGPGPNFVESGRKDRR